MSGTAILPRRVVIWWVPAAALLLALLVQLFPVLHRLWLTSPTYSHGYLVLGLVAWLVLREYKRAPIIGSPSWLGLTALVVVASVAVFARVVDIIVIQQLAVPALLIAGLCTVCGMRTAARFAVPLGYLGFAVSVWDYLITPLRETTTVVVGSAAYATSIPVHIVGNSIHVPAGTFEIEDGCSGLRYVITAAALAVCIGLVQYRAVLPRVVLLMLAMIVAVMANWVRVYLLVLIGHLTEMQHYLVTVDHFYFGWAVFMVMLVPVLLFSRRLDAGQTGAGSSLAAAPARRPPSSFISPSGKTASIASLAAVVLAGVLALNQILAEDPATALTASKHAQLPASIGEWRLEGNWMAAERPTFVDAESELHGYYSAGDTLVSVYAAGYYRQRQGSELIHYSNRPLSDRELLLSRSRISVPLDAGRTLPFRRLVAEDRNGRRRLVWLTYDVAGRATDNDVLAKIYQAIGALRGRHDAHAIVLSAECSLDCADADRTLTRFGSLAVPILLQSHYAAASGAAANVALPSK